MQQPPAAKTQTYKKQTSCTNTEPLCAGKRSLNIHTYIHTHTDTYKEKKKTTTSISTTSSYCISLPPLPTEQAAKCFAAQKEESNAGKDRKGRDADRTVACRATALMWVGNNSSTSSYSNSTKMF
jgi:hypothetical protein